MTGTKGAVALIVAATLGTLALASVTVLRPSGAGGLAGQGLDEVAPVTTAVPARPERAAPEATPLWTLNVGQRLGLHTEFEELDGAFRISLQVWLDAVVTSVTQERVALEATVRDAVTEWISERTGHGPTYDTRAPQPESPIAALQRAIGRKVLIVLDPRDGAVLEVGGMAAIAADVAMIEDPERFGTLFRASLYQDLCAKAFSDEFIRRVLTTLCHVRGDGRPLPWDVLPRPGEYFLRDDEHAVGLVPLSPVWQLRPDDRFRIDGQARYAGGRLREASAAQELARTEPNPQAGAPGVPVRLAARTTWKLVVSER